MQKADTGLHLESGGRPADARDRAWRGLRPPTRFGSYGLRHYQGTGFVNRGGFLASRSAALLVGRRAARRRRIAERMRSRDRPNGFRVGSASTRARWPRDRRSLAYDASEHFPTASTIKVLIMATAYVREEAEPGALAGATSSSSRSELIGGSDFMIDVDDGSVFTVRAADRADDSSQRQHGRELLISHFGVAAINAVRPRAGMTHTHLARHFMDFAAIAHHNDNVPTPADMARLLYRHRARRARGAPGRFVSPAALPGDDRDHARPDRS